MQCACNTGKSLAMLLALLACPPLGKVLCTKRKMDPKFGAIITYLRQEIIERIISGALDIESLKALEVNVCAA